MQDVPNIARARLRQQGPDAEAHPDADLLTAFAEQALAEPERARVTEHLARCGDCREVVALALPADEEVVAADRPAYKNWLSLPVLRWGVVAAGIVLVTSVGILQFKERHQQKTTVTASLMARNETAASVPQSPVPSAQVATPQAVPPPSEIGKKAASHAQRLTEDQLSLSANRVFPSKPPARTPAVVGGRVGGGMGYAAKSAFPRPFVARNSAPAPAQPASPPPASQAVEVQSAGSQITATADNQTQDQLLEKEQKQSLHGASANSDVVKAKPPVLGESQATASSELKLAAPGIPLQTSPALMVRASPRWTISSTGGLQRSFDAGKTWEDVAVTTASSPSRARMGGAAEYNYKGAKSKRADEPQPSATLVFRAVAAIGSEVWAGGSGAMLYHSADSGGHWTRVLPAANGAVLTGDITSVEFADPQRGRVATSTGEVWITSDNGQSWQKQ